MLVENMLLSHGKRNLFSEPENPSAFKNLCAYFEESVFVFSVVFVDLVFADNARTVEI